MKTIANLLSSLHPKEINIKDQLDKCICLLVFTNKIADQTNEIKNKLPKLMQSRTIRKATKPALCYKTSSATERLALSGGIKTNQWV